MNKAQDLREKQAEKAERSRSPAIELKSDHHRWNALLGRGLFETVIVAVGVFLALVVDEWRDDAQRRQLASDARAALRSEMLANRELVIARLSRIAQLYRLVSAEPEQVGRYVFERQNRPLLLSDTAWTLANDSGALRWLEPEERSVITEVYTEQRHVRDLVTQEMAEWTKLAAADRLEKDSDHRWDAVRVWQAYAQRVQLAQCVTAGRYERAFGAAIDVEQLIEFCSRAPVDQDPGAIYREWARLGWVAAR